MEIVILFLCAIAFLAIALAGSSRRKRLEENRAREVSREQERRLKEESEERIISAKKARDWLEAHNSLHRGTGEKAPTSDQLMGKSPKQWPHSPLVGSPRSISKPPNIIALPEFFTEELAVRNETQAILEAGLSSNDLADLSTIIDERKLRFFHFTDLRNVGSILENGLLPRNHQSFKFLEVHGKDNSRLDDFGTCFSVGFPNYKMLHSKSQGRNSFAIIEIDSQCLTSGNWLAYPTNSAVFAGRHSKDFTGTRAFVYLFENNLATESGLMAERDKLKIDDGWTTDPQAEVIINDAIPSELIKAVHFKFTNQREYALQKFDAKYSDLFIWNPDLFKPRADYKFWADKNRVISI
jgi:hypothetical protein